MTDKKVKSKAKELSDLGLDNAQGGAVKGFGSITGEGPGTF